NALKNGDLKTFEKVLRDSRALQNDRALRVWGIDDYSLSQIVDAVRNDKDADEAKKRLVYTVVRDMDMARSQGVARAALLELDGDKMKPMDRLLAYQNVSTIVGNDSGEWDALWTYAQAAMVRKDYPDAATLVTGMLANISVVDSKRKQIGRDLVGQ